MERGGYVYIMSNKNHTVLYVGVTSQIRNRVWEHKTKKYLNSFTSKYNVDELVYYESYSTIEGAIYREKQLKAGSRMKKNLLINNHNPKWLDLFDSLDE